MNRFSLLAVCFTGGEIRWQSRCTGRVPKPATMAALGLGAAALLFRRRRRA